MNDHIRKAKRKLEEADFSGFFEEIEKIDMPPRLKTALSQLRQEFIVEAKGYEYYQRAHLLVQEVEKEVRNKYKYNIPKLYPSDKPRDRKAELSKLDKFFESDRANVIVILHGSGGYGKSFLAKKYITKNFHNYDEVMWVEYKEDIKTFIRQFNDLNADLEDKGESQEKETEAEALERALKNALINHLKGKQGRNLLIIDDANSMTEDFKKFIGTFGTYESKYRIIITSRAYKPKDPYFTGQLNIDRLPKKHPFELFKDFYDIDKPYKKRETEEIKSILKKIEYNTLFIVIVAQIAQELYSDIRKINQALDQDLAAVAQNEQVNIGGTSKQADIVINTLYELSDLSDEQKKILHFCALFSIDYVYITDILFLFDTPQNHIDITKTLHELNTKGWLIRSGKRFKIHSLVEKLILSKKKEHHIDINFYEIIFTRLCIALITKPDHIYSRKAFINLAEAIANNHVFAKNKHFIQLKAALAKIYIDKSGKHQSDDIEMLLDQVKDYAEQNLDEHYGLLLECLENYSYYYFVQGEKYYDKALEYESQASEIRQSYYPNDDFVFTIGNYNKGLIYKGKRLDENTNKAIDYLNQSIDSLESYQQSIQPESYTIYPDDFQVYKIDDRYYPMSIEEYLINAYDNIGDSIRLKIKDDIEHHREDQTSNSLLQKATVYLKKSIDLGHSFYEDDPDKYFLLRNYTSLGHLYKTSYELNQQEVYRSKAKEYHTIALKICKKLEKELKRDYSESQKKFFSRNVVRAYQSAAEFFYYVRDYKSALKNLEKVITIRETTLTPNHHKLRGSRTFKLQTIVSSKINKLHFRDIQTTFPEGVNIEEVKKELANLKDSILKKGVRKKDEANKLLINIVDTSGSHQTSYRNHFLKQHQEKDILYLSSNSILESILLYEGGKKEDAKQAFERWEMCTRVLVYDILCQAFKDQFCILFESDAIDSAHLEVLESFKAGGYEVEVHYLNSNIEELQERAKTLPAGEIKAENALLLKNIKKYQKLLGDKFYDNRNLLI